jgi:chromosomal replication initiation ATPase DnaA
MLGLNQLEVTTARVISKERPEAFSSMREACAWVACKHGVTPEEITGRNSRRVYNLPREEFILICRDELDKSFQQIANFMGGRNHSTIIHYLTRRTKRHSAGDLATITRMRDAAEYFAKKHGITVERLIGRSKDRSLTPARLDFIRFCKRHDGLNRSYNQIGAFMGQRDGDAVRHYTYGRRAK